MVKIGCIHCLYVVCLSAAICLGQEKTYSVKGTLVFPESGDIFLTITTNNLFKKPAGGVQQYIIRLDTAHITNNSVPFQFDGLAPGTYGIKCFQDVNGNGTLDSGMFGPTEPWGMSWNKKRPWGPPKFKQISFSLQSDISDLIITLK